MAKHMTFLMSACWQANAPATPKAPVPAPADTPPTQAPPPENSDEAAPGGPGVYGVAPPLGTEVEVWSGRATMFVKAQIGRALQEIGNGCRVYVDWQVASCPMEKRSVKIPVKTIRWRRLPEELPQETPVPCSYCGLDDQPRAEWVHTCSMQWCNNCMHSQSSDCGQRHGVYVDPNGGYCCPAHIANPEASQKAKDAIALRRAEAAQQPQGNEAPNPSEKELGKRKRANYAQRYSAGSSTNPEEAGVRFVPACVRPCCRSFVHAHAQRR